MVVLRKQLHSIFVLIFGLTAVGSVALFSSSADAATQTFSVKADTYASQVHPDSTRGDWDSVRVYGATGSNKIGYVDFGKLGLAKAPTKATLTLHVKSKQAGKSIQVKIATVAAFSEANVTYNKRPAVGKVLATVNVPEMGSNLSVDVSAALKVGLDRFAIIPTVTPSGAVPVQFGSREGGAGAKLTVDAGTTTTTSPATTTPTTSPATTTPTTSPATTTPTTSPGGGGLKCSNPKKLTGNQGSMNDGAYLIQQDVWSGEGQQTMDVCSFANWRANVTESGAPETGVKTYPDSGKTYTDWSGSCTQPPKISSFPKLTSTYSETAPGGKNSYDWAYDIFLNGSGCGKFHEIMIWNDFRNISVPNAQATPTIGGIAYDFYHSSDAGYLQFRMQNQNSSGTVDLMAIFKYLQDNGFLKADGSDEVQFVQYGPEVLTTYGVNTPFYLNNFSITDK